MIEEDWISLSDAFRHVVHISQSEKTAEIVLLEAIRNNNIAMQADYYLSGQKHADRKLEPDHWSAASLVFWKESRIEYRMPRSTLDANKPPYYAFGDFVNIKLLTSDIEKIWPQKHNSKKNVSDNIDQTINLPPRKGIGGAVGDFDWEEYLIEAAIYMHVKGVPKSQNKLFEYLWEKYGGKSGGPSPGSMKTHLGPLYRRFKQVDEDGS